ncbi:ATP-binding protein [Neisseria perflava]|uniref:ATP-binding protein n=1 Tax=Neisseria perflava TaxID=33053 RepID=UPI003460B489
MCSNYLVQPLKINISEGAFGADKITISDNGDGMPLLKADRAFSNLGNSWKKGYTHTRGGKSLHGEKGEGRFKAFALGRVVNWKTIYKEDNEFFAYSILAKSSNLHEVEFSENNKSYLKSTRTIVEVTELLDSVAGYDFSLLKEKLTVIFSSYLFTYPSVNIYISGEKIDPNDAVESNTTIKIDCPSVAGSHEVRLIEWKDITEKNFFCVRKMDQFWIPMIQEESCVL